MNVKYALAFALLGGHTGLAAPQQPPETCQPLSGFVRLDPDPTCAIKDVYPGPNYLGVPGTCFSVSIGGDGQVGPFARARGFAGLTAEVGLAPLTPPKGAAAITPMMLVELGLPWAVTEFNLPQSRRVFTARSAIVAEDGVSKVFSADVGILGPSNSAVEQLLIVGGEGVFARAGGEIVVLGNSLGRDAPFVGRFCPN